MHLLNSLLLSLFLGLASADTLTISHRIQNFRDTSKSIDFTLRGTIELPSDAAHLELKPADAANDPIERWINQARPEDVKDAWYQVALRRPNDGDVPDNWDLQSVRMVSSSPFCGTNSPVFMLNNMRSNSVIFWTAPPTCYL